MAEERNVLIAAEESAPPSPLPSRPIREAFARDAWGMLGAAIATVTVELGVYLLALRGGVRPREALLAALGTMTMWTALASPALAAAGGGTFRVLLRAAIPADASAICLLVLSAASPFLTLPAAVKIYCTLAAMAALAMAAAACARTPTGRYAAAVAVAVLLAAAITTPFWTGGLLQASAPAHARAVVTWAVYANPFYCITASLVNQPGLARQVGFIWHEAEVIYDSFPTLRDCAPPSILWYPSALICAGTAGVLGGIALLRGRRQRRT